MSHRPGWIPGMRSVPAAAGMLTPSGRRTPLSPAAITRSAKDLSYQAGALVDTGTAQPPSNRSAPATGGAVDVEVVVEVVAARAGPASRARAVTAAATARIRVIRIAGHSTRKPRTLRQTADRPQKRRTGGTTGPAGPNRAASSQRVVAVRPPGAGSGAACRDRRTPR